MTRSRHRSRGVRDAGVVILIDSLRSFVDQRRCRIARTDADGVALLRAHEFTSIQQLWLDYDLGSAADGSSLTAASVVEELLAAARDGRPYAIDEIRIHATNSASATRIKISLQEAGYRVFRHYDLRTLKRT